MLKFNAENSSFEGVRETGLKAEKLLERKDFQKAIVSSWDLFKNYIGFPSAFLIGEEVKIENSGTNNSIDILAFNPDDSSIIVIELKRDKHKLQLLQGLSYAAMVSRWNSDALLAKIQEDIATDVDELQELIKSAELSSDVQIVLIAEAYDPEVIITADWLSSNYSVNISAFAASIYSIDADIFVNFEQRYPLREIEEAYEWRIPRRQRLSQIEDIEWKDVIPMLAYDFAEEGIELCKKWRQGDAARRRFSSVRTSWDGFEWITIAFRRVHVSVYLRGQFEGDENFLHGKFSEEPEIGRWRDGLSIKISSKKQFDELADWLQLKDRNGALDSDRVACETELNRLT